MAGLAPYLFESEISCQQPPENTSAHPDYTPAILEYSFEKVLVAPPNPENSPGILPTGG